MSTPLPWWRTDTYDVRDAIVPMLEGFAGPHGLATVGVNSNGTTTPGWGEESFMQNYTKGRFLDRQEKYAFEKRDQPFALVMRSMSVVCIDIDGKNGGLEHAKRLGALPHTLAETSKSGDGYHLFYWVADNWDDDRGYTLFRDRIAVEQGVDFRGTGCVYRYPSQRWNGRSIAKLPSFLEEMLLSHQVTRQHAAARVAKVVASTDEMELLMLHDELLTDLAKPIPAGRRNNTLFAIGQRMKEAQVPNWETLVGDRAQDVGLSTDEVDKLVRNIEKYN